MVATGRGPTLPPDLEGDACASPALEDPASYVEVVKKRLTLTHLQMTPPPAPVATNPYCEGSLIFAMTTPSECINKLAPRWKGPFVVKRVPNPYQVTYEDGLVWRTIHVNHAKLEKPLPLGSLHLYPHLHHLSRLWGTSRGVYKGLSRAGRFLLLNQPPQPRGRLNQPQRNPLPRLPRAGNPHAQQPIEIRLLALCNSHQPLLGEPMIIRGRANSCGALHA